MNADSVFDALVIPADARVDQRVPKKLLVEQGAPTASDKRLIHDGIEELRWFAALKPSNIGVPAYRDAVREYVEIVVLGVTLRNQTRSTRLTELIQRAIPYPVLLVTSHADEIKLSLAHKRFSQGESGQTVLDGALTCSPSLGTIPGNSSAETDTAFLKSLPLADQPRVHLCALYQGWMECLEASQAARISGRFVLAPTMQAAADRRAALIEHDRIQREIANHRARAETETQINRRVELNLEIRRLEGELATALSNI
jgi:Domain of unknown function (DUF4391)